MDRKVQAARQARNEADSGDENEEEEEEDDDGTLKCFQS